MAIIWYNDKTTLDVDLQKNTDMSRYIMRRPHILKEATYTLETDSHLTFNPT